MLALLMPRLFLFIWVSAVVSTAYGTLVALLHLQKEKPENLNHAQKNFSDLDPVTILKPLKGIDEGIEKNLESFLELDYPKYEVLFSVADENDPVVSVVRRLMSRHPEVTASLTICSENLGPNPKINNLLKTYHNAKYDWILISDSNTRVSPSHLKILAEQFKHGVAMQTSIVAGVNAQGLGGLLECAFLNTFYARSVLALSTFGHICVIGKAMLFRKSILERTGGLRALEVHIAEDYAAGRKLYQLGFRVQVSRNPIRQHIGPYQFRTFWSRHIRWGRLRKMQTPLGFLAEPLFNSILSGILGAIACAKLFHFPPFPFLSLHFGFWFLCDLLLFARVADLPNVGFIPIWVLREVLHFPLWIHIAVGNSINWRGKIIHLVKPKNQETHFHPLHGLQEFLRNPQKHLHLNVELRNSLNAITDATSLFDEEWEQDWVNAQAYSRMHTGTPLSNQRGPPERADF